MKTALKPLSLLVCLAMLLADLGAINVARAELGQSGNIAQETPAQIFEAAASPLSETPTQQQTPDGSAAPSGSEAPVESDEPDGSALPSESAAPSGSEADPSPASAAVEAMAFREPDYKVSLKEALSGIDYAEAFELMFQPAALAAEELVWLVKDDCRDVANFVEYDDRDGELADGDTPRENIVVRFEVYKAGVAYLRAQLARDANVYAVMRLTVEDEPQESEQPLVSERPQESQLPQESLIPDEPQSSDGPLPTDEALGTVDPEPSGSPDVSGSGADEGGGGTLDVSLVIADMDLTMWVGDAQAYSAEIVGASGTYPIAWMLEDTEGGTEDLPASLEADDRIKADGPGTVVLKASADVEGMTVSDSKTIVLWAQPEVTVSGEKRVVVGGQIQMTGKVDGVTDDAATWTLASGASGTRYASIDENGLVTGVAAGLVTVTATVTREGRAFSSDPYAVSVMEPQVILHTEGDVLSLTDGATLQVSVEMFGFPEATQRAVSWRIMNTGEGAGASPSRAIIDQSGLVTALNPGDILVRAFVVASGRIYSKSLVLTVTEVPLTGIRLDKDNHAMASNETLQLNVLGVPEEASSVPANSEVTWAVTAGSAVAVSDSGLVTPVLDEDGRLLEKDDQGNMVPVTAAGATVSATWGDMPAVFCDISLRQGIVSLEIDDAMTVAIGGSDAVRWSILPETANQNVSWVTSDESIATVNDSGVVTGIATGETTLTATFDGGVERTLSVSVMPAASGFEIIDKPRYVAIGASYAVGVKFTPEDSTVDLTWTSSDTAVAKVNGRGVIQGVAEGEVTISVACAALNLRDSFPVTIVHPVEEIRLFDDMFSFPYLVVGVGQIVTLPVTLAPESATVGGFTSADTDGGVYAVTNGASIRGVKPGFTSVVFTSRDGLASRKVNIRVLEAGKGVTSLTLNKASVAVYETNAYSLIRSVNASASYKSVKWASSDEGIATVSANGRIKGVEPGTCFIYCLSTSGLLRACQVTVLPIVPTGIAFDRTSLTMYDGSTYQLTYNVLPYTVRHDELRAVSWYTSNPMVALVTDTGEIHAMSPGKAIIAAKTVNGKYRQCTVLVRAIPVTGVTLENPNGVLALGGIYDLVSSVAPLNASNTALAFASSNSRVAAVNALGQVKAFGVGSAVITAMAKDGSGKRASVTLMVRSARLADYRLFYKNEAQEQVLLANWNSQMETQTIQLDRGSTLQLSVIDDPAMSYVYRSSDEGVATVSSDGLVTAVGGGKATISSVAGGQYELSFEVNVPTDNSVTYRALVIGQFTNPSQNGYLTFCKNDCYGVRDVLSRSVLDGNRYSISGGFDYASGSAVLSKISSTFADADDDDVSVIYMNAHGGSNFGSYRWFLGDSRNTYLTGSQIVSTVSRIKGNILLIMASCFSGTIISDPGNRDEFPDKEAYSDYVTALAEARDELSEASASLVSMIRAADARSEGSISVMCAATDTRGCYFVTAPSMSFDFFTNGVCRGMGWDMVSDVACGMEADTNGDGLITIGELAPYAKSETANGIARYSKKYGTGAIAGPVNAVSRYYVSGNAKNIVVFGN